MKKKLPYVLLLAVCICLFSFKNACGGDQETCLSTSLHKKTCPVTITKEYELSPLYNFLVI